MPARRRRATAINSTADSGCRRRSRRTPASIRRSRTSMRASAHLHVSPQRDAAARPQPERAGRRRAARSALQQRRRSRERRRLAHAHGRRDAQLHQAQLEADDPDGQLHVDEDGDQHDRARSRCRPMATTCRRSGDRRRPCIGAMAAFNMQPVAGLAHQREPARAVGLAVHRHDRARLNGDGIFNDRPAGVSRNSALDARRSGISALRLSYSHRLRHQAADDGRTGRRDDRDGRRRRHGRRLRARRPQTSASSCSSTPPRRT